MVYELCYKTVLIEQIRYHNIRMVKLNTTVLSLMQNKLI